VPVSLRIESALPSGQRRRVLHTFTTWQPGNYGDTSTRPSWSPSGRLLAFGQAGRLAIMRGDGTGLYQLPQLSDSDSTPAWSPDGRRLAFSGMRACLYCCRSRPSAPTAPGCGESRTMRRTGRPGRSGRHRLPEQRRPVADTAGTGRRPLQHPTRRAAAAAPVWPPLGLGTQPDWSPDGRRLAFNARGRSFTMTAKWPWAAAADRELPSLQQSGVVAERQVHRPRAPRLRERLHAERRRRSLRHAR
jgi:dipeptidyl aminopeptidase/acylaminoacyl peptidase